MTSIILSAQNTSNSKNNELRLKLPMSQSLVGHELALGQYIIYYSWPNITDSFLNRTGFAYRYNGTTYNITFDRGYYSVADISNYINMKMKANGHYLIDSNGDDVYYLSLQENPIYYKVTLTVTPVPSSLPSGWSNPAGMTLTGQSPQLVITSTQSGNLIGYTTGTYPSSPASSTTSMNGSLTPQIHPVQSVSICCNLINNIQYSSYGNVLYIMTSQNVEYGAQIMVAPQNPFFYPIVDNLYSEIVLTLRDQNGNDLDLIDTNMNAVLLLRPRKY